MSQESLVCLACDRSFWTRRSYYRHKRDCRGDAGEAMYTSGGRIALSPDELVSEDEYDLPV